VKIRSRACWHPLQVEAIAKPFNGPMPCTFEETPPHIRRWNRLHRSSIEVDDLPLDLRNPRSLRTLLVVRIQAGEQGLSECSAVVGRKRLSLVLQSERLLASANVRHRNVTALSSPSPGVTFNSVMPARHGPR
jgi:hypothetical protein